MSASLTGTAQAAPEPGQPVAGNTPSFVAAAQKTGLPAATDTLTVSLWLKPRAGTSLDAIAADLYNPASPNFRHWLTNADIRQRFAPSAQDAARVQAFLTRHGLTYAGTGPDNFYVRAQGSVAAVEQAFKVKLANYTLGNKTFRANNTDPVVDADVADLVAVVSGLDNVSVDRKLQLQPARASMLGRAGTNAEMLANAASATAPDGFSATCFLPPATETFTTHGGYPKASYTGTVYQTAKSGCGYTPANIIAAYHLDKLYAQGLNGSGQTIALIEPCGSPTVLQDANGFNAAFALPALTAANFSMVNYPSPSVCEGYNPTITADLEWAHAIAPGATIQLVIPPTSNMDDIDSATFYAVTTGQPQVVAGSYAVPEYFVGAAEAKKENLIAEFGAVTGIASNYASGNYSDFAYFEIIPKCAAVPADLPFATGVGGVSAALDANNNLTMQTGWETHLSNLVVGGQILDPPKEPNSPNFNGFISGSGGGASVYFRAPAYQAALNRKRRMVPDIAWLADPQTGGLILVSQPNVYPPQLWFAYGGTELANVMFSALWAIAGQAAGTPLGQAAPTLYAMPSGLINDILPRTSVNNVTATVHTAPDAAQHFTAAQIFYEQNSHLGPFLSALAVEPGGNVNAISFGQDYYSHTTAGWDTVTGLGTPNAAAFVSWFLPQGTARR